MSTIITSPETVAPQDFVKNITAVGQFVTPGDHTKIYKDECLYCFHTPFFEGGVFVCLNTYTCFCSRHVVDYVKKSNHDLFVQIESKKVFADAEVEESGEPTNKITKLAIGMDKGFDTQKFEIEDSYHVVLINSDIQCRCPVTADLGERLHDATRRVISAISAERLEMLQNASNAWDGEQRKITKHADLVQLQNNKTVPSSGWKCEEDSCDLTENLWLNLTDGSIRCGRSQYVADGTLSKGNNHMKLYYDSVGFPLVVKLGTIMKDGTGDVYSYDEDDAVIDPHLVKHLAHFGLDPAKLEKTEKSTLEMELDMNQAWEWSKCQEDGVALETIFGPGYTGLINIGSSCYMNSVLQALSIVPSFQRRFAEVADKIFQSIPPTEVPADFNSQVAKVFRAMLSGDYSIADSPLNGISPKQFKRVVGANHAEFSTARQQDAEEYIRFFFSRVTANTSPEQEDPSSSFRYCVETRFEDIASGHVRYSDREEFVFALHVRPDLLTAVSDTEGRFKTKLATLIEAEMSPDVIDGFTSPITGEQKGATNTLRFKTFPDFLFIVVQRFTVSADYTQKKLDMDVEVDDVIDLEAFQAIGKKDDEQLLPEEAQTTPAAIPEHDMNVVEQLKQMGFSQNAAIKAAIQVFPARGTIEEALEWLMGKLDEPTINDPPVAVAPSTSNNQASGERACVQELVNFGFTVHQATYALQKHPDANAAAEWLFEHAHEVPAEEEVPILAPEPPTPAKTRDYIDGSSKYSLCGLISHMGSSPHSGHYVAHILKDGKWVLFNDEKVAISQNPPKQLAYIYMYRRI